MSKKSNKAFGVTEPIDMLAKLEWEFDKMRGYPITDRNPERSYYAINAATTTWHLCEWLAETMTAEQFAQLSQAASTPITDMISLRNWATSECYFLKLCDQLANGAKHMNIRPRSDDIIAAEKQYLFGADTQTHYLMVKGDHHESSVDFVIGLTLAFWRDVFVAAGMATREQVTYPMVERTWAAKKA